MERDEKKWERSWEGHLDASLEVLVDPQGKHLYPENEVERAWDVFATRRVCFRVDAALEDADTGETLAHFDGEGYSGLGYDLRTAPPQLRHSIPVPGGREVSNPGEDYHHHMRRRELDGRRVRLRVALEEVAARDP